MSDEPVAATEPASAPPKGGAWKWIVIVVLGAAAIAFFLDRERIARELSPPPAPSPSPPPSPGTSASAPPVEGAAAPPQLATP